jgi:hypothetical protein
MAFFWVHYSFEKSDKIFMGIFLGSLKMFCPLLYSAVKIPTFLGLFRSAEMALKRTVPPEFYNYAGAHCSAENPSTERNPGLKRTWMDAILF